MRTDAAAPPAHSSLRLAQHRFGEDVLASLGEVLASGHLTLGPRVAEFETAIAAFSGLPHGVAASSGTTALHLALAALDIGPGDEVIVPDFTHPATGHVVLHTGALPVLVDVDPRTYTIDPVALESALTPRTKLVIAVDLFGMPADYRRIEPLLAERGIPLLCDAACSIGAEIDGVPTAQRGIAATFSFHPRKVLTTGEGGMLLTADDALADRLRLMRNQGFVREGTGGSFTAAGFNYRLSDVLAVIGSAQVPQLAATIARRNELAGLLSTAIGPGSGFATPTVPEGFKSSFQAYVGVLEESVDRDRFIEALASDGVEATIGTYALHGQPSFSGEPAARAGELPVSLSLSRRTVALPLHPGLSDEDVERIAAAVDAALEVAS